MKMMIFNANTCANTKKPLLNLRLRLQVCPQHLNNLAWWAELWCVGRLVAA